jgi:hypothetical protein
VERTLSLHLRESQLERKCIQERPAQFCGHVCNGGPKRLEVVWSRSWDEYGWRVGAYGFVLLALIVTTVRRANLTGRRRWFIGVPFSVYFGWSTVAVVANITVLLLDNRSTAMTGGQNNPGNGHRFDGTPAPIVKKIEAGITEAMRSADVREKLEKSGLIVLDKGGDVMGARVAADIQKWVTLVRERNIQFDQN